MTLLHSSITHLDLGKPEHVNSGSSALSLMVDIVRPHLPHIESLSLPSMMIRQTNDRDHALIQLAAFAHLRVMRLQNVEKYPLWTTATVTMIASFPKLRELEANFGFPADVRSSLHEKKIPMGFFELRKLTLVATPPDIAAFLDATDPPCLDSLTMVVSERRTAPVGRVYLSTEDLERFYPLIPRCIRRIELFLTQFHSPYARHPSLDLSASRLLHPVLRDLDTLREISVSVEHAAAGITDEDMRELCATWPNLTHFEFVRWHGSLSSASYYTTLPRFSTMLDFIRAHPHLVHLALPTLCVAGIPDVGTTVTAFPHVRHLRIGRLVRGTPLVPLAIALDSAFPNLDLGSVAATQVGSLSCSEEDEEDDGYSQQSDRDDDTVTVECELILRAALLALQTSRRSQPRVCKMTDGRTPALS
ncbi:hypothetical protein BN946_scf184985.g11 [Trametes cinnabarina]|uniref:F-box domain-containing protein n=1 Tax=Pycnoporus cinnabarinus TaxID=5643 RepID=A0A060SDJ9_PYCCI|nr:hypothetical protein BN946_scf184985.g11 [Trametes cinnabarina]